MFFSLSSKFQILRLVISVLISVNSIVAWASQDALVVSDKAVIYSDEQMTSPVGYVSRGKKVKVGEVARNHQQVYPIVISGKVAYIKVIDVSTEKENLDSSRLVAERFQKNAIGEARANYSLLYYHFSSQIGLDKDNGNLRDKDPVNWSGFSFQGNKQLGRFGSGFQANLMKADEGIEQFRVLELGFMGTFLLVEKGPFRLMFEGDLLINPFASYAYGSKFRINGFGFTFGGGLHLTYKLSHHWGLEAFGGFYYTKLTDLKAPGDYNEIAPTFIGNRLGLGGSYYF